MTENEFRELIIDLRIQSDTKLVLTFFENENVFKSQGKFEFFNNGLPAIQKDRVGIRIRRVKGANNMPYVNGLTLIKLISITLDNE